MSRKFILGWVAFALLGLAVAAWLRQDRSYSTKPLSQAELDAAQARIAAPLEPEPAAQTALVPLKMSQSVRLAVGGLGLAEDGKNRQLGDLLTVELNGAKGFELVERQSLDAIFQELNLSRAGLVRAKDAVRVGKLLKADWFLLGTESKISDTNFIVARVVDARTGIIRDAGIFPADKPLESLASDLAGFLRQVRQNAADAKLHVYLALGAFEDLSINNRQAKFPSQLRGYLTAAYHGGNVTLLEREYVETLIQEVYLDMAGLTEDSSQNSSAAMQSAYWLVDGQFQSYETTNLQIELNLEIQRAFGKSWQRQLRALPGDPIGRQTKAAIDGVMQQNPAPVYPTRRTEARMQMDIGRELSGLGQYDLVVSSGNWQQIWLKDPEVIARRKQKILEAIRAFQTILLLEPTNRMAKVYLAMCFRHTDVMRLDEACNLYRELIDEPTHDPWSGVAQDALVQTFLWYAPDQKIRWLQSAVVQTTNRMAASFYQEQVHAAEDEAVLYSGENTNAELVAEKHLLEKLRSADNFFHHIFGSPLYSDFGMNEYMGVFAADPAKGAVKLAELLPKMKAVAPDLAPYLVTHALGYQVDTNTPLIPEFQATLTEVMAHPNPDINPGQLWVDIGQLYYWCLDKKDYPLAIQVLESMRESARQQGPPVSFGVDGKMKLAYAYLAVARWQDALGIFESFSNRPVIIGNSGPWGAYTEPVFTDKMAAFCKEKLGLPFQPDPRLFDIGKPLLSLCAPSIFVVESDGLWIGISGQLLHLDFNFRTNLAVDLPTGQSVPITALSVTPTKIWIGTQNAGLIEFDRAQSKFRHLTEADGLLMNNITSLEVAGDSLWIGYGGESGGGLGQFDLRSQKIKSFMPSLTDNPLPSAGETPPHKGIGRITADSGGDLWMSPPGGVRQYHVVSGIWTTLPNQVGNWLTCFDLDAEYFVEGGGIGFMNAAGGLTKGTLAIENLRDHGWKTLEDPQAIPAPPSTMTLDGNHLWVGGGGTMALVDLKENKVKKFCQIKAPDVDRIQIAGGYVWAQFNWHLYRVPLSAVE